MTNAPVNSNHSPSQPPATPAGPGKKYHCIKLGIDWHAHYYKVVRIIDNGGPEPAQRFTPEAFLAWVQKQLTLAEKVYSCYEAGAGGFVLHRQLTGLGVINYVSAPRALDPDHKGVLTDKTDSRQLALDLDRFVGGNPKALRLVYVPTPEQEQRRQESRQRQQMLAHRQALAAQGRSLLLSQGVRADNRWWKPGRWEPLVRELPAWLVECLDSYRRVILAVQAEVQRWTAKLEAAAPEQRPRGFGALTLELLDREVCDWHRFKNRKQVGSYAGLCGGVWSSGGKTVDLPLTKAGNRRLRGPVIELAWRLLIYQPQCRLIQRWKWVLLNPRASRRARKRAIVAVGRQLLTDLWRWRTGRAGPEALGWVMSCAGDR